MARGAPWGHFNFGSTVILLWPAGSVRLAAGLSAGQALRVGQAIGRWQAPSGAG